MRVLTMIDSLAIGGAEQSLAMMTPHLVARGIDVHVAYLTEREGVHAELVAGGATLHSLAGSGGRLRELLRAIRLMRTLRPALVHTTLFKADVIGRVAASLLRIPVVSSFVTESYGPEHVFNPEYRAWKVRAAHLVDAATARLVARFHAVSESSARLMAERLRIPADTIDVIPRGRDPDRLGVCSAERRHGARRALGVDDGVPVVLAAARHYHTKGLDVVVAAWAAVLAAYPDARLVIAGRDGPATPELRILIATSGVEDAVLLAGYRSDVSDLMCAADVFVLPSRTEGSPGVLLEAMALEVPVVASDIPSVREIAGSEPLALLVPVDDHAAMAAAIVRLLGDDQLAKTLARTGRERFIEHYTMGAVADATVALYRSVAR